MKHTMRKVAFALTVSMLALTAVPAMAMTLLQLPGCQQCEAKANASYTNGSCAPDDSDCFPLNVGVSGGSGYSGGIAFYDNLDTPMCHTQAVNVATALYYCQSRNPNAVRVQSMTPIQLQCINQNGNIIGTGSYNLVCATD